MTRLIETIQVQVPPNHLFTHLSTLWESGEAFPQRDIANRFPPLGRMGLGVRLPFSGDPWGASSDSELEIREYVSPVGWSAVSTPASCLTWDVEIAGRKDGALLTCVLRYAPDGFFSGLGETLLGKRVRRRKLRRLLDAWRMAAERNERLQHLRSLSDQVGKPVTRVRA